MKRMICFLIVLVLCLSFACPAFATAASSPDPSAPSLPDGPPASQTGDTAPVEIWFALMLISLLALVAVVIFYRKSSMRG